MEAVIKENPVPREREEELLLKTREKSDCSSWKICHILELRLEL